MSFVSNTRQNRVSTQMLAVQGEKERVGKAEHPVGSPNAVKGPGNI